MTKAMQEKSGNLASAPGCHLSSHYHSLTLGKDCIRVRSEMAHVRPGAATIPRSGQTSPTYRDPVSWSTKVQAQDSQHPPLESSCLLNYYSSSEQISSSNLSRFLKNVIARAEGFSSLYSTFCFGRHVPALPNEWKPTSAASFSGTYEFIHNKLSATLQNLELV